MKTVLCCGVFDLFHVAHVAHLKEARSFGEYLVVALTVDECVGKKGRPVITWQERADILVECRSVDEVIPNRDSAKTIRVIHPDIYVKGSDYAEKGLLPSEIAACEAVGAHIRFTKPHPTTTSGIIERINKCA